MSRLQLPSRRRSHLALLEASAPQSLVTCVRCPPLLGSKPPSAVQSRPPKGTYVRPASHCLPYRVLRNCTALSYPRAYDLRRHVEPPVPCSLVQFRAGIGGRQPHIGARG